MYNIIEENLKKPIEHTLKYFLITNSFFTFNNLGVI